MQQQVDVLVIGAGLAGMSVALRLAHLGQQVALVTKRELNECSSYYAQGGIAAVINPADSFKSHVEDTLVAGAGLCKAEAVQLIVENAPAAINWLISLGVPFTKDKDGQGGLHLTREGGHSARRVLHVADATGRAVIETLIEHVNDHPNIHIIENAVALDLIVNAENANRYCAGAYLYLTNEQRVITLAAQNVVLATGGAGKAYLYTTNPDIATGDGIAMGFRAGVAAANMEFIQFHPTCLYHAQAKSFLISEAVRGEGGILRLPDGTRFMAEHDPRLELAPRDIVARAIDFEMKKYGLDHVLLYISHKPKDFIIEHFPNIYAKCLSLGIDISHEPIPVVPAAHYTCGGLLTDLNGQTSVNNLFAVGECAYTGLHGANRLASNSLLECLVIGERLVTQIQQSSPRAMPKLAEWDESQVADADEEIVIAHNWDELRRLMWDYVGIVRSDKRLMRALRRVRLLKAEVQEYYANFKVSADLIELRNLIVVAELIILSAMQRHESRGLHYSLDYPNLAPEAKESIIYPV
jgi:L-aspartate oxidase